VEVTFTEVIETVLGSTLSVAAIEVWRLLLNVVSAARAVGSSVVTASCKLLLNTLVDSASPLFPVAVAAEAVTASDVIVVVTVGGFA
jgi:hypothetical protein